MSGGTVVAEMARPGWFRHVLGRGQAIRLPDGRWWRLMSVEVAKHVCPVVVAEEGGKVAIAEPAPGGEYRVTTRDRGFSLVPGRGNGTLWRAKRWTVREWGDEVAIITRRPRSIVASRPIPLGAVLVAFAAIEYGIPGEGDMGVPPLQWNPGRA